MSEIQCRKCGDETGTPPDELKEYEGLCPFCLLRQETIIPDPEVRKLFEAMLNTTRALNGGEEITVVVTQADKSVDDIIQKVLTSPQGMAKIHELIEGIKEEMKRKGIQMTPNVRNDPRTG